MDVETLDVVAQTPHVDIREGGKGVWYSVVVRNGQKGWAGLRLRVMNIDGINKVSAVGFSQEC